MNALSNLVRNVLVLMLALAGIAMAFVLMVSTAIALGVMYVVARVRGRPFAPAEFWRNRAQARWQFVRPGVNPGFGAQREQQAEPRAPGQPPRRFQDRNVIDVEARDIR